MSEKRNSNMSTWPVSNLYHNEIFNSGQCMGSSLNRSGTFISLFAPSFENHQTATIHGTNESILANVEKFDMQTSDACHKRFVIFDHTVTKNTVIVHPSWLNNHPCESALEPKMDQSMSSFLDEGFNQRVKETMPSFFCFSPELQPNKSMLNNGDIVQGNTTMGTNGGFISSREKYYIGPYHTKSKGEIGFSQVSRIPSEFHEDTEEIDVLLNSDDELSSTGHSPSDASSNYYHASEIQHKGNSCVIGTKRKLENMSPEENDDADSNQTSFQTGVKLQDCSVLQNTKEGHCENAWNSSLLDQACFGMNPCSSWSENSSGTLEGPTMDPIKRTKIKTNINQLRNVIPGGNGLDTVGLLTQTVEYVMLLEGRLRDLVQLEKFQILTKQTGIALDG